MRNLYVKLVVSLAIVAGVAAGLLAFTYHTTAPKIAEREAEEREKALQNVFFLHKKDGAFTLKPKQLDDGVIALYRADDDAAPAYYAVAGQAIGFNSSVPVTLMVGFTNSEEDAAALLDGYVSGDRLPPRGSKGKYIVGFSVISSEETPGLGEKIKDARPPYTWAQKFGGDMPEPDPDSATDFQRQFRGRLADTLLLKKNGGDLDAITASTLTSNGVLLAIQNASEKL